MTGVYFLTSHCLTPLLLLSPAGSTFIWQKKKRERRKSEIRKQVGVSGGCCIKHPVHSSNIYSAYFVQFPATAFYKPVTMMTFSVLNVI